MASLDLHEQLLKACESGADSEIDALIAAGAEPAYQNAEGVSGLMLAAENGHLETIHKLLQSGAPWNAQDKEGYCAGEYASASKRSDVVELLLEWGVQAELLLGAAERYAHVHGNRAAHELPRRTSFQHSILEGCHALLGSL
jgi:protein arginine N-methyltransferase 2